MKKSVTPRVMLVSIAALFILPLVMAWFTYTGTWDFKPGSTKNYGTLINPPLPIDWSPLRATSNDGSEGPAADTLLEHWVIFYPLIGDCLQECEQQLVSLRQIHLAAGRNGKRIRLAVLMDPTERDTTGDLVHSIYDRFILLTDETNTVAEDIQAATFPTLQSAATYLIDPLGNIMMAYAADADPNDLKKDLKQLLTWSKLDDQS